MGKVLSTARDAIKTDDERKAKEQLELMTKLADARLDTFESKLKNQFLDRDSAMKTSVPGRRALRFERYMRADVHEGIGEGISEAVNAFFGASKTGGDGVLAGFKAVVETGLTTLLGDTSAGETFDEKFFVCIKHNAVVRVDMYSYKYAFNSTGVISQHKNILAYILCISVVDHRDVTADELIYLASEFAGDGDDFTGKGFQQYLENLMNTWNAPRIIDPLPGTTQRTIQYPTFPISDQLTTKVA